MTKNTYADFDFDAVDVNATELIFRLGGGREYLFAILDQSVREQLVEILLNVKDNFHLDQERDWEEWDYSNEPLANDELIYPWTATEFPELELLSNPGELSRVQDINSTAQEADVYFVRFFDTSGNYLIAAKETNSFKSLRKKRIAFFSDNRLIMSSEPMFHISDGFNFIFDTQDIFVFNPRSFEKVVGLEDVISAGTKRNAEEFCTNCTVIKWEDIEQYVSASSRRGNYLRSIVRRGEYKTFDTAKIKRGLDQNDIDYIEHPTGQLSPQPGNELIFLRFLDHSVYGVEISSNPSTNYLAANRSKIKK